MTDERLVLQHGSFTSSSSYVSRCSSWRSRACRSASHGQPEERRAEGSAHLAINRYGQVPVLRHRGLTLVMSNVILDYLARATGHFELKTEQHRWQARCRGENDVITNVARVRHFARFRPDVSQDIVNFFRPQAECARLRRQVAGRARGLVAMLLDRRHRLLGSHGLCA